MTKFKSSERARDSAGWLPYSVELSPGGVQLKLGLFVVEDLEVEERCWVGPLAGRQGQGRGATLGVVHLYTCTGVRMKNNMPRSTNRQVTGVKLEPNSLHSLE